MTERIARIHLIPMQKYGPFLHLAPSLKHLTRSGSAAIIMP